MIKNNVDFVRKIKISPWRKFALGTWRNTGDCSVYSIQKIEISNLLQLIENINSTKPNSKITLSHVLGKICGLTLEKFPQINTSIRYGKIYQRKHINIFYQVASDKTGEDLSGCTIENINHKTITEIASEIYNQSQKIKSGNDADFKQTKKVGKVLPGLMVGLFLKSLGFILYTLNIWHPLMGIKKDCFGSMMITNIGSLGIQTALVPLVSYSRIPLILALGKTYQDVFVENNEIKIGNFINLNWTFDHRLIDGVVASQMSSFIENLIKNPHQII